MRGFSALWPIRAVIGDFGSHHRDCPPDAVDYQLDNTGVYVYALDFTAQSSATHRGLLAVGDTLHQS
jgi:hypothetical protein